LREGPETVAAFIGEPVMAAGGVIVPPAGYWTKVQEVCRKHDILIIADEVITGFGRLGQPFGSNVFGIDPDIMVLSKQITSSYQPLSAVLFSEEIYQHIADETARIGTFGHGFTASGHPVAAAVALENIKIIEEDRLVENSQAMGTLLHDLLRGFADHPLVGEIRGLGLIAGVELVADRRTKRAFEPAGAVGAAFFRHAQAHGLIIRAIGDTIALSPPLIIKPDQVKELVARFRLALEETLAWSRQHAS
jgi:4-aminobutyrate---pyruvate transaminase